MDMTLENALPRSTTPHSQGDLRAKAEDAKSKIGDKAKQPTDESEASDPNDSEASDPNDQVKTMLGERVGAGADLVGHLATSARVAAGELDRNAPQIAGLVRDVGRRMEQFSQDIRGQSVDQLVRKASDFTRERPAVMFGAAAACGFFLFRLCRAAPVRTSWSTGLSGDHDHQDGPGSISSHYGQSRGP
jgi:ElaB/YqjD/DUF883 family membrane-anchored ribosome-binding protein